MASSDSQIDRYTTTWAPYKRAELPDVNINSINTERASQG